MSSAFTALVGGIRWILLAGRLEQLKIPGPDTPLHPELPDHPAERERARERPQANTRQPRNHEAAT
eukprot:14479148-Alexandrium_andersonii.AAC.1